MWPTLLNINYSLCIPDLHDIYSRIHHIYNMTKKKLAFLCIFMFRYMLLVLCFILYCIYLNINLVFFTFPYSYIVKKSAKNVK